MSNAIRFWLIILGFMAVSCQENRWDADLSQINYQAKFTRLDRMVFDSGSDADLQRFAAQNPKIINGYLQQIMQITPHSNPMTEGLLSGFRQDPNWMEMQTIIDEVHGDLGQAEGQLTNAFKRYAHFFNDQNLPQLVGYNSGFNYGVYPDSLWLGVGLEWYCGADNAVVRRLPPDLFPAYKRQNMAPRYLVPNALIGWLMVRMDEKLKGDKLLDVMVFYGKVRYTADVLLEETSKADLFNYTEAEIAFCEGHEYQMWNSIVSRDVLFSADTKVINQLTSDGPFTPGMPTDSPGGAAVWLAYRMVAQYMDEHPDASLQDLWVVKDSREILKYYKPRR